MPLATARRSSFPADLPATLAGLWALHALTPPRTRREYEAAATLATALSARRMNAAQRAYHDELCDLVAAWEDAHGEASRVSRTLAVMG